MMRCHYFSSLLERYLDGELRPEEMTSIREHLQSCPRCQKEIETLRSVQNLLRKTVEVGAADAQPYSLWEGVMERLTPPTLLERVWWRMRGIFFPFRPLHALAWGMALMIVLWLTIPLVMSPARPSVVVESIQSEDPVMIFQGEGGITIIWLFEEEEGKEG